MYDVYFENLESHKKFVKRSLSPYFFRRYLKKVKYSKKVRLIGYTYEEL